MKYSAPEIEILNLDVIDVIQTSNGGTEEETPGTDNPGKDETPFLPNT